MALFYSDKVTKKRSLKTALQRFIPQELDYQGLGVAKQRGKTWFIENALPNEVVEAIVLEEKRYYGQAQAVNILEKSEYRQTPFCPLYGECGGCQMQHIPLSMQRESKQLALFQKLQHLQIDKIDARPMIIGNALHYRRRARLSVAWQNNQLVMGFRQAKSQKIVPVSRCDVLEKSLVDLLTKLPAFFSNWQQPKSIGHLEFIQADNGITMLLRHIGQLHSQDSKRLSAFAIQEKLLLFVMTDKDTITQWHGEAPYYKVNGLKLYFSVQDFIQVNALLNQQMVNTAIEWLNLTAKDSVLDLFCGIGNFTLPIAQKARHVVGVEGVQKMVEQARYNAEINHLDNASFYQADLDQPFIHQPWATEQFNKVLLDPARQGALFALEHLCQLQAECLVYVSCNPATLVRDAEKLITMGYKIIRCAIIDMFPHTAHLESISLFVKKAKK